MNCYFYSTPVVVQLHRAAGHCYFWPSGSFIGVKLRLSLVEMKVSYSVWRNLLLEHLLDACKYWFLFFWDDLRFSFSRMFTSFFFSESEKSALALKGITFPPKVILEIYLWLARLILEWSKKQISIVFYFMKNILRGWVVGCLEKLVCSFELMGICLLYNWWISHFFLYFKDLPIILCC